MKRNWLFIALAAMLSPVMAAAQVTDCPRFPAPCPHSGQINQAMDLVKRGQDNLVTPQELAMESTLRNAFADMLLQAGRQRRWQVYEIMESDYDRPNTLVSFPRWCATPFEKRPPHVYEISFIIIVNKDSLQAWRVWYKGEFTDGANRVVGDIRADAARTTNDQQLQSLTDSLTYYTQLTGKYTQDHYAEFMTAIQNNDLKGQKRYNDQIAKYQKKQDALVARIQNRSASANSASTGSYNRFESDKVSKTGLFTGASVLLVHFAVNTAQIDVGFNDDGSKRPGSQKTLNVPGAFYARLFHNPSPPDGQSYLINEFDYGYNHPANKADLLFGKWQPGRNGNGHFNAAYAAGKAATDLVSLKAIKCDAVQNIAVQIEGRPDKITETLSGINFREIQKLLQ